VVNDYNLPAFSAPEAMSALHDSGLDIPFIVVSGAVGEETAAALMKAGADDFLLKDRLTRPVPAVRSRPSGPDLSIDMPLLRKPFTAAALLQRIHDLLN
jgi:CheY-like chemotaxis protein